MNITPISTNFNGRLNIKKTNNRQTVTTPISKTENDDIDYEVNKNKTKKKNKLKLILNRIFKAIVGFFAGLFMKNKNKNTETAENKENQPEVTNNPPLDDVSQDKSQEDFETDSTAEVKKGKLTDEEFEKNLQEALSKIGNSSEIDDKEEETTTIIPSIAIDKSETDSILKESEKIINEANSILEESLDKRRRTFSEISTIKGKIEEKSKRRLFQRKKEEDSNEYIKDEGYYKSLNELDENGRIKRRTSFNPDTLEIMSIEKFKDGSLFERIVIDASTTVYEDTVTLSTGITARNYDIKHIQDSYVWKNGQLSEYESDTRAVEPNGTRTKEIYQFSNEELVSYSSDIYTNISESNIGKTYNFKHSKLITYSEDITKDLFAQKNVGRKISFDNSQTI